MVLLTVSSSPAGPLSATLSPMSSTKYSSSPFPPVMLSAPAPPSSVSSPSLPVSVSLPSSPDRAFLPALPVIVLAMALPAPSMSPLPISVSFSRCSPRSKSAELLTWSTPSPASSVTTSSLLSTL